MIITIVILSLLVISLGYSTFNLLKKAEKYEEMLEESDVWMVATKDEATDVINNIRKIDSKGIFEEDDEVGQTFKQILTIIERLENVL